jgi:hypothetical protein
VTDRLTHTDVDGDACGLARTGVTVQCGERVRGPGGGETAAARCRAVGRDRPAHLKPRVVHRSVDGEQLGVHDGGEHQLVGPPGIVPSVASQMDGIASSSSAASASCAAGGTATAAATVTAGSSPAPDPDLATRAGAR